MGSSLHIADEVDTRDLNGSGLVCFGREFLLWACEENGMDRQELAGKWEIGGRACKLSSQHTHQRLKSSKSSPDIKPIKSMGMFIQK